TEKRKQVRYVEGLLRSSRAPSRHRLRSGVIWQLTDIRAGRISSIKVCALIRGLCPERGIGLWGWEMKRRFLVGIPLVAASLTVGGAACTSMSHTQPKTAGSN